MTNVTRRLCPKRPRTALAFVVAVDREAKRQWEGKSERGRSTGSCRQFMTNVTRRLCPDHYSQSLGTQPVSDVSHELSAAVSTSAKLAINFPATGHHCPLAGIQLNCMVTEAQG